MEFTEGNGGVAAVPVSWLLEIGGQLKCYWPKTNANKAVRKQASVRADWQPFAARKLSEKIYASFDSALQKEVKDAMFTSSIETESDEEKKCKKQLVIFVINFLYHHAIHQLFHL